MGANKYGAGYPPHPKNEGRIPKGRRREEGTDKNNNYDGEKLPKPLKEREKAEKAVHRGRHPQPRTNTQPPHKFPHLYLTLQTVT